MLSTSGVSQISLQQGKLYFEEYPDKNVCVGNQVLCLARKRITSYYEIKKGELYFTEIGQLAKCIEVLKREYRGVVEDGHTIRTNKNECYKIIATTSYINDLNSIPVNLITNSQWILDFYNKNKRFPEVVFDEMESPISIFNDEDSSSNKKAMTIKAAPMTKSDIIQWMKDAYVMIGENNDQGTDEGKCLLGALIEILKKEATSTEPTKEEVKSIWRNYTRLMKQNEFSLASGFVNDLIREGNISAMRMCIEAIKGYKEMAESKKLLKEKIESIIGKIN